MEVSARLAQFIDYGLEKLQFMDCINKTSVFLNKNKPRKLESPANNKRSNLFVQLASYEEN